MDKNISQDDTNQNPDNNKDELSNDPLNHRFDLILKLHE